MHLLSLLRVIIIEGNYFLYSKRSEGLFDNNQFIECIVEGMKNKQNFVSYHYIKFAEKIVAFIAKSMDPDKSCEIIKKLIKCFCDLIQNADVC